MEEAKEIIKWGIIGLCVCLYGVVSFYNGELPIKDLAEFKGWLALVGILAYVLI